MNASLQRASAGVGGGGGGSGLLNGSLGRGASVALVTVPSVSALNASLQSVGKGKASMRDYVAHQESSDEGDMVAGGGGGKRHR
jgi:hypothetical protein